MTLGRAMEVCLDLLRDGPYWPEEERREALTILLKAGERCQRLRSNKHYSPIKLLPGETKE